MQKKVWKIYYLGRFSINLSGQSTSGRQTFWNISGTAAAWLVFSDIHLLYVYLLCIYYKSKKPVHWLFLLFLRGPGKIPLLKLLFYAILLALWKQNHPVKWNVFLLRSNCVHAKKDRPSRFWTWSFSPNCNNFLVECDWNNKIFQNVQILFFFWKKRWIVLRRNPDFFKVARGCKYDVECLSINIVAWKLLFQLPHCSYFLGKKSPSSKSQYYLQNLKIFKKIFFPQNIPLDT